MDDHFGLGILRGQIISVVVFACVILFSLQEGGFAGPTATALEIYDQRIAAIHHMDSGEPLSNITGNIVWHQSYLVDGYVEAYRATGDSAYVDHAIALSDRIMAARADATGTLDFRGRQTYGWLTGQRYTLGVPVVLEDANGNPSLEIRTTAHSHNNLAVIEILPGSTDGTFRLDFSSTRVSPPYERSYDNLTMSNVESRVNPPPGPHAYLRVRRLGDAIPAPVGPFTPDTSIMVLHGHHTGRIVAPILRMASLILASEELSAYRSKAEDYVEQMRITFAEHDQFFRESFDGRRGWTIFELGAPFWSDGVVEPHNTLAASGTAYLAMYQATGEPYFRERTTQLAQLIRDHHIEMEGEKWLFHYWWGEIHDGWEVSDEISTNTQRYPGILTVESVSHLQLTLDFIVDCYQNDIVFTREDLEAWARTVKGNMLVRDDLGLRFRSHVDGEERGRPRLQYNQECYGFIRIAMELDDDELLEACQEILFENFTNISTGGGILSWATLALAQKANHPKESTSNQFMVK